MKAVLALVIIYVGTFFVAIQGASQNSVQAAQATSSVSAPARSIDPAKEADIRSLLELIGAQDQVQETVHTSTEQYREKLLATMQNNAQGQALVNNFVDNYQKKFDPSQMTDEVVAIYDKHYTDEEIKGLLQFFGSPLGQKVASEMPKIGREIQSVSHEVGAKAAREALQALKEQNPNSALPAHLGNGQRRWQQRGQTAVSAQQTDSVQP